MRRRPLLRGAAVGVAAGTAGCTAFGSLAGTGPTVFSASSTLAPASERHVRGGVDVGDDPPYRAWLVAAPPSPDGFVDVDPDDDGLNPTYHALRKLPADDAGDGAPDEFALLAEAAMPVGDRFTLATPSHADPRRRDPTELPVRRRSLTDEPADFGGADRLRSTMVARYRGRTPESAAMVVETADGTPEARVPATPWSES